MKTDNGRPADLVAGQKFFFARRPDYGKAEGCFRDAIRAAPDDGVAYHWLAAALRNQGKLSEACEVCIQAIERMPSDPRPMVLLAYCLHELGKSAEALSWVEKGLALKPHYGEPAARLLLAEIHERLGQTNEAVEQWKRVKELPPEYPDYRHPGATAKRKLAEHARRHRRREET